MLERGALTGPCENAAMSTNDYDLVIVGAGPAGLATAAHAKVEGLRYALLERSDHLADTIFCYQKRKLVMAEPSLIPLRSEVPFTVGSREEVLGAWDRYVTENGIRVAFGQEVAGIARGSAGLTVTTRAGKTFSTSRVVLAVGTQGNPRRLGVPGEDLPHVSSRLVDPDAFSNKDIVVVGAGDSAIEVALALCEANRVHLIVRTSEIVRAKESLEREALSRMATGQMTIHFSTTVREITHEYVDLKGGEDDVRVPCQQLILKIGATPPRRWLEEMGVKFVGDGREARPRLGRGYESTVPGLHMIGAVTGRDLIKLGMNQGYEVVEHILGRDVLPADEEVLVERLPHWQGTVRQRIETLRNAVPLLYGADEDSLRETFLLTSVHEYGDGDVIMRQNDYTDSLLIVTEGGAEIRVKPTEGDERAVAVLKSGNFFGEMGLLSGRRRNATAIARGPQTRVLEIPRKAMLKLLQLAPEVRKIIDSTFLIRALRSHVFPTGSSADLRELAALAKLVEVERGAILFSEGQKADAFYLVRHGMIKLTKASGEREIVLTYLTSGNYFGEGALFDDAPRTATATTIFKTEVIVLSKNDVNKFLLAHPDLRKDLEASYERRKLASLSAEASPGAGEVLSQMIETEAVIGTDVLVIDNHKCVRCDNCIEACIGVHDDGQSRLSLTGNRVANLLLPNSCMQCENPLCMLDCPPDAIVRRPEGEVFIKDNCIGCGNCAANCPYDNIFMVQPKNDGPFGWLKKMFGLESKVTAQAESKKEVAVKCDLCRDVRGGPACVRSCPTGAAIRLSPKTPEDLRRQVEEIVELEIL